MAKCAAITAAGSACKGVPMPGESYCYVHHPDTKEERRKHGSKGARRGGRGRPSPISAELARLQALFERLADDVLEGKQDRSAAAVAIQALNGARGCVIGALKAREQEELAKELEELKSYVQDRGASRGEHNAQTARRPTREARRDGGGGLRAVQVRLRDRRARPFRFAGGTSRRTLS
jgi:alkylhydroperoxidase family enzyme